MINSSKKKKYVFLGDTNSVNIEIILKSHSFLKEKLQYLLVGNKLEFEKYVKRIKSKIKINEIFDPINFYNYKKNYVNIFNIEDIYRDKYKNLLNQINLANKLSCYTKYDLITMPINKSIMKKNFKFIGLTEYLGKLNNCETTMLMYGENFSVIPLTTHINLKNVSKNLNEIVIKKKLDLIMSFLKLRRYDLNFKEIKFLCYNPHCGEDNTIGIEDKILNHLISKNFKKISGPYPADSAFNNYKKNTLYISTYHDQALIPYKIVNKKGFNLTLGLSYRRLSPAHGTAEDIIFKNLSNNSSYLACMLN